MQVPLAKMQIWGDARFVMEPELTGFTITTSWLGSVSDQMIE